MPQALSREKTLALIVGKIGLVLPRFPNPSIVTTNAYIYSFRPCSIPVWYIIRYPLL